MPIEFPSNEKIRVSFQGTSVGVKEMRFGAAKKYERGSESNIFQPENNIVKGTTKFC